jgi:hypothetical protein
VNDEDTHKEFLLAALRAASARARAIPLDIDTIGVALKGDLIGADTAVAWIKEANLMWLVGPIPSEVGRVAAANETTITLEMADGK